MEIGNRKLTICGTAVESSRSVFQWQPQAPRPIPTRNRILTFSRTKGLSINKGYILLLDPRPAAAGGHLLRFRSSTMTPHRLRRGALHLPVRRSRQNATFIY
jgi:hypothetical protein